MCTIIKHIVGVSSQIENFQITTINSLMATLRIMTTPYK
jgi:hypothetical protein